jgi:hypothetical protein
MWVQAVVFDVPSSNLLVNPVAWFGAFTTLVITIGLGILSMIFGYLFLYRIIPKTESKKVFKVEPTEEDESETEEHEDFDENLDLGEPIEEELPTSEESEDS